ncbi:MAG: glycosyltransferase family 4 protein [Firmicutes bacterium]|nr:glycosyltransferase family 4 protein [Dethiobacter sp.]MCL4463217.1 glycosyltransferase family 4 protein [Bacillota bacterium]MCL5993140.1 glycosyltransferase family 4 protein [Bacillota bacterium]
MKIGMFTDSYRPYTSGVVRSIETTARKLTEFGHEVYIFAPSYPVYEKESGVFRFPSVRPPIYPEYPIALPFSLHLNNTVKRLDLDVIHVHSPITMGMLGSRCAKRFDIPLVFTYHTMYDEYVHYLPFAQGISRKAILRLSTNFCNGCDLVITPTEVIRQIVAGRIETTVQAIPTGIEIEEFIAPDRLWLRREYGIAADVKILLHLGRLGKEKNVSFLLKAYSAISKKHPDTKLVIVGEGPERKALQEEATQLGLLDVLFTGKLSRRRVVDSFASADLFVFASTTETQGLVLGEAKAAGVPTVAVKALGAAEMVTDGVDGFLTPLSLELFAARVDQLLANDGLRRVMAERALLEAEKISSTTMAQRILLAYEQAARNKKATLTK